MVGGCGLVHPQPAARCLGERRCGGGLRAQLRFEPVPVRAEQLRRHGGLQARAAGCLRLRQELLLEGELRLARVPFGAVRPEHALPVGAAQAIGHAWPFRRR